MGIFAAIWQKLVWCGLIGGVIGLLIGAATLFHRTAAPAQNSLAVDIVVDTLLGTFVGMLLLGVPASLWVSVKWAIHRGHTTTAVGAPPPLPAASDTGRAVMIGSTAGIPLAIGGAVAGLLGAGILLGCIMFISLLTGAIWFDTITKHWLVVWFGSGAAIGALIGFLGGTFIGGALGALFGGARALTRH